MPKPCGKPAVYQKEIEFWKKEILSIKESDVDVFAELDGMLEEAIKAINNNDLDSAHEMINDVEDRYADIQEESCEMEKD